MELVKLSYALDINSGKPSGLLVYIHKSLNVTSFKLESNPVCNELNNVVLDSNVGLLGGYKDYKPYKIDLSPKALQEIVFKSSLIKIIVNDVGIKYESEFIDVTKFIS